MRQLQAILRPMGYAVEPVSVRACLHLKTAATALAGERVLLNPCLVDAAMLGGLDWIEVDAREPLAANVLSIGGTVLCPVGAPHTQRRLEDCGYRVLSVDVSELAKAEGGLTCCSVVFNI